jgi:hypothetical protein
MHQKSTWTRSLGLCVGAGLASTVQVIPPNQITPLHTGIDFIENAGNPPKGFAVCSTNIDVWPLQSGYDGPHS